MSGDYDEGEHALLLKVDAAEAMYDALVLLLSFETDISPPPPITLARGLAVDRARVALAKAEGRMK